MPASRVFSGSAEDAVAIAPVLLAYLVSLIPMAVLFIVQRTCRARLFGGNDAGWFLFWGYQFFIVMAALGYVLGISLDDVKNDKTIIL